MSSVKIWIYNDETGVFITYSYDRVPKCTKSVKNDQKMIK